MSILYIFLVVFLFIILLWVYLLQEIKIKQNELDKKIQEKDEEIKLFREYMDKKDYIMTYQELKFYKELKKFADENNLTIFTKIRLADLVNIKWSYRWDFEKLKAFNKIKSKHIDFLIAEANWKIIKAIELDDYSHKEWNKRDEVKNNFFEAVWIKLFRFKVSNNYVFDELI